jgi:hypothetical protein
MKRTTDMVSCNEPGCPEEYASHKWGTIKANGEGWFIQKDGIVWCPKHTPSWVADWRRRQAHYRDEVLDIEEVL